jgi:uncharacterized protein YkwD
MFIKLLKLIFLFIFILESLPTLAQTEDREVAAEVLRLINAYRESKRLSPFVSEPIVYQQALEHSLAMVKNDDLSHDGFDKRVKEINKTIFSMASAENVAFNQGEDNPAKTAFEQWKTSRGHNKNMLGNYTHTGLAVAKSNDGKYYFTQIFIRVGKNR